MTNEIDTALIQQQTGIKTYQLVVSVTSYMEGTLDDWPNNIQDGVLEALEKMAQKAEHPLTVVYSACAQDFGSEDDNPTFHICVIASEIVAADDRIFQEEKERIRNLISDIENGTVH